MAASDSHFKGIHGETAQQKQGERSVTVEEKWDVNPDRSSSDVSIFRVPDILITGKLESEAYVPKRVSLGPYHHGSAKLRSMDSHKERARKRMTIEFNNVMNGFFSANLQKMRDSYEEQINCNEEQLVRKLTFDGCFILEILSTLSTLEGDRLPQHSHSYEPLFERKKILYTGMDILHDILKLENQIPFIVLVELLKLQRNSTDSDAENKLFEMMVESLLRLFYPFESKKGKMKWSWPQPPHHQEVHHLLDWLRIFIDSPDSRNGEHARNDDRGPLNGEHARNDYISIPGQDEESVASKGDDHGQDSEVNCFTWLLPLGFRRRICNRDKDAGSHHHIHRAIELGNAGIKLERCEGGIANIKFDESRNAICLPRITIKDSTEILFRNLIAFEMCKPSGQFNYVACYVGLMDQLIDNQEDVALLRKKKILTNLLGSDEEVAQLFNSLCKGVTVDIEGAFDRLTEKVHKQYNNKFRVELAELVKEYFSSTWKTLGLLGGIALLLLSIVQTTFAILAVYK